MTNEQIDALVELPEGVPQKSNDPEVIYLGQTCCADPAWGKSWTADVDCFDCDHGIAPTKYLRADLVRELAEEVKRLRGTIAADDERLRLAGERTGLLFGCDTAEHLADEVLRLRAEHRALREGLEEWLGLATHLNLSCSSHRHRTAVLLGKEAE